MMRMVTKVQGRVRRVIEREIEMKTLLRRGKGRKRERKRRMGQKTEKESHLVRTLNRNKMLVKPKLVIDKIVKTLKMEDRLESI